jgi:hypothetical protein
MPPEDRSLMQELRARERIAKAAKAAAARAECKKHDPCPECTKNRLQTLGLALCLAYLWFTVDDQLAAALERPLIGDMHWSFPACVMLLLRVIKVA